MNNIKNEIKLKGRLKSYLRWPLFFTLLLVVINVLIYSIDFKSGLLLSVFVLIYLVASLLIYYSKAPAIYKDMVNFATEYGMLQKTILKKMDLPYCLLDKDGRILWVNERFEGIFQDAVKLKLTQHHIDTLIPNLIPRDIEMESMDYEKKITYNGRSYRAMVHKLDVSDAFADDSALEVGENEYMIALTLFDDTEVNRLMKANEDEKLVAGLIYIDNYDEALESIEEVRRSLLIALVDRKINRYIGNVNGVVKKLEKDKYFIIFKQKFLNNLQSNKFSLLDEVKSVNIGNDMSVTISIGLGAGGTSYIQNCNLSRIAIDLALGRGGDQAIIKEPDKVYYYGGKSKSVEKNTRVKARIKAHALKEILDTKDKVIIMGHSLPDVDCFGSAVGLYRAIRTFGKKAYVVINTVNSTLKPIYDQVVQCYQDTQEHIFVQNDEALELLDDNTLVIIVDVNRPSYMECPELLEKTKSVVLLDHHRQCPETVQAALLSYVEPFASSTCEMVAEILQYIGDDIRLRPQEADALYAGILLDTNYFTNKTGVRTFEAAAFLRRSGADVIRVQKLFRDNEAEFKAKAEIVQSAEIYMNEFAIAKFESDELESPTIVGAQAANDLMNMKGIKASFVVTAYNGKNYISARSIDEINVQLVMERFGGGGHLNMAGAQIPDCSLDEAVQSVKDVLKSMIEEGDL